MTPPHTFTLFATGIIAILLLLVSGCAKEVPVALPQPAKPAECSKRHPADLPDVPDMMGLEASPAEVAAHVTKHRRGKDRPAYRSLYRSFAVCARYVKGL